MNVLIVDNYTSKTGFKLFYDLLVRELFDLGATEAPALIQIVKSDDLHAADLVLDWQNGELDSYTPYVAREFDKLDVLFIGSDSKRLPWDPKNAQLVALINMAHRTGKPLFCSGGAALTTIWAAATLGKRLNIINGPHGETLEHLATHPIHLSLAGANPRYVNTYPTDNFSLLSPTAKYHVHLTPASFFPLPFFY